MLRILHFLTNLAYINHLAEEIKGFQVSIPGLKRYFALMDHIISKWDVLCNFMYQSLYDKMVIMETI